MNVGESIPAAIDDIRVRLEALEKAKPTDVADRVTTLEAELTGIRGVLSPVVKEP